MSIKRFAAVLVSLALLLPIFTVAAEVEAADMLAAPCGCGEVVQVWVDGFGTPLYYNEGTPAQAMAEMIITDTLTPDLKGLLKGVAISVLRCSWEPLAASISKVLFGLMGHLQVDETGRSVEPLSSHWTISDSQARDHANRPGFNFSYDYRMDPFELAVQLDDFIETLCGKTGHEKIALCAHSEGANVVMAYVSECGTGRLETLTLGNGGWQGLTMAGQLFVKRFALEPAAITNYIANYDDGSGLLRAGMDLLRTSRLLNFTPALGRGLTKTLMDPLYEQFLIPLFCQMSVIWSFVPDEYFEGALQVLGDDPKYDALKAKVIRYHEEVFLRAPDLLKQAQADGVKVAVIAAYGPAPLPVTKDVSYLSDSLIDTATMSGGATTAPIGKTLPPSGSKYRSPDGMIDAITCALPDQTWFIKYNGHDSHPSQALRQWIIHSQGVPTVFDNPEFPQYLKRTPDGGTAPLRGDEPEIKPAGSFLQALWAFMKLLLKIN